MSAQDETSYDYLAQRLLAYTTFFTKIFDIMSASNKYAISVSVARINRLRRKRTA